MVSSLALEHSFIYLFILFPFFARRTNQVFEMSAVVVSFSFLIAVLDASAERLTLVVPFVAMNLIKWMCLQRAKKRAAHRC